MAAGPTLKSAGITNADASPRVSNTAGEGASYRTDEIDGYVTPAASDGAGTKYLMVRVPTFVKVKRVKLASEAQGAGKVNVGVYYADSVVDLPPSNAANAGLVANTNSADFFATDVDLASAVPPKDVTYLGTSTGKNTFDAAFKPLWQAIGLTTDPGGKFDIVCTVHTTDITTGTGKLYLAVEYTE